MRSRAWTPGSWVRTRRPWWTIVFRPNCAWVVNMLPSNPKHQFDEAGGKLTPAAWKILSPCWRLNLPLYRQTDYYHLWNHYHHHDFSFINLIFHPMFFCRNWKTKLIKLPTCDQMWSNVIKCDRMWSNVIKCDQIWSNMTTYMTQILSNRIKFMPKNYLFSVPWFIFTSFKIFPTKCGLEERRNADQLLFVVQSKQRPHSLQFEKYFVKLKPNLKTILYFVESKPNLKTIANCGRNSRLLVTHFVLKPRQVLFCS